MLKAHAITTAIEIGRLKPIFDQDREYFHQLLTLQARIRGLPVMEMIDKDLAVVERADIQISQTFAKPSRETLARKWCSIQWDAPWA